MSLTPSNFDPTDPPVCLTCKRVPFWQTGRFVHVGRDQHTVPNVKPASQVPGAILKCDFCSGEPSVFVYTFQEVRTDEQYEINQVQFRVSDHQNRNYNAKPTRYIRGGVDAMDWGKYWFTCQPCTDLIEAKDLMGLVGRAVDAMEPRLRRGNRLPTMRGELVRTYEPMLAAPHARKPLGAGS